MTDQLPAIPAPRVQYAALPYRRDAGGGVEILLLTSRDTGRWVVPKGWPMKGRKPRAAAAREAREEAGLVGRIGKEPLARYGYDKRLRSGRLVPCVVELYPLEVRFQRRRWPEKGQRTLRWLPPEAAADAVDEPELGAAIRGLAARLRDEAAAAEAGAPAPAAEAALTAAGT